MKYIIIILACTSLLLNSCKTQETAKEDLKLEATEQNTQLKKAMSIIGDLAQQGVTAYQYGSHTLKTENTFYALRSKEVVLDDFVGKKVKVIGVPIAGYPLSGGPKYIKVLRIEIYTPEDKE